LSAGRQPETTNCCIAGHRAGSTSNVRFDAGHETGSCGEARSNTGSNTAGCPFLKHRLACFHRYVIRSSSSGYRAPCTVIFAVASSSSRRSSGVSSMATAPMFSSRRSSWVVPGIDNDPRFLRKEPSERDLNGSRILLRSEGSNQIHQSAICFAGFRREAEETAAIVL
jgi:hypothetical protein